MVRVMRRRTTWRQVCLDSAVPVVANLVATAHNNSLMVVRYTITLPPETTIGAEAVAPMAPRLTVFRREGDKWLVSAHANFAQPTR